MAEELDEIVALARKETVSRLRTLLVHLLKWKYQATNQINVSWKTTIDRERSDLELLLDSKNLRNYIAEEGYDRAPMDWRAARLETRCSFSAPHGIAFFHKFASGI